MISFEIKKTLNITPNIIPIMLLIPSKDVMSTLYLNIINTILTTSALNHTELIFPIAEIIKG